MPRVQRLSPEEIADRGDEIYERDIRSLVEPAHRGEVVAIDIETGLYEVAEDVVTASDRLLSRAPNAEIWFVRAGDRALHRMGAAGTRSAS